MKSFMFGVGAIVGVAVTTLYGNPMLQRNFPCAEDEVLMFVDTPSKADLGCVHIDDLVVVIDASSFVTLEAR